MGLKLWKIEWLGHDRQQTYDSAVVVAGEEGEARKIHPSGKGKLGVKRVDGDWPTEVERIRATYLGECYMEGAERGMVICASFNGWD